MFDWFDVHEYVLTQLHHHRDTAAPGRYRLLGDTTSREAHWEPDTQRPVLAPTTPSERALCAAIQTTHGHEVRDVALTYTEAGGRILSAPAVVEHMRRHGFTGLRQEHFTTPYTLRATARLIISTQVPSDLYDR